MAANQNHEYTECSVPAAAMDQYLAQRQQMIDKEHSLRHDQAFRQRASPLAKRAACIVQNVRERELRTVWKHETRHDIFGGMSFTRARDTIHQTTLWKIVQRLPKGSLLHAHFEAMVDMPWLLDEAFKYPGLAIFSDKPLVDESARASAFIEFQYVPDLASEVKHQLFEADYVPGSYVPLRQAARDFPGGDLAFKAYLLSRITITDEESTEYHSGIDDVWRKFASIFPVLNGIVFYEPIFRTMLRRTLEHLLLDGIQYIDLRIAFLFKWTRQSGEPGNLEDLISTFQDVLASFQAAPEGHKLWGGRIIWTTLRSMPPAEIETSMKQCMDLKKKYPDVIAGFDLVGQEGLGHTLLHHLPQLLWFRAECDRQGLDLPFFFHAGEVLGDGDEHDMNVVDAVLLGTKRIGHGYSLHKHPETMRQVRERDICVEVCPISNETLRLNASIMGHPLPAMLAHGVPTVLANDDPGVLGHGVTGSSHDFYQVIQAFQNVGLEGLGDIAETSVWFSAFHDGQGGPEAIGYEQGLPGGTRRRCVDDWRRQWEEFCSWIVAEYGEEWENTNR
ncbi:cat eye syndrome chromosome region, candidate 1 [Verticillium nonalfalfae]|uniref:adenosine deaminase n=1 Tax=Verticillium nonalfalfae TaxID=1051616 RepID=A0A3M9Y620_9PEZI|nr:cat eye syndrome chromosome region, candidate 1 [Verticillium nonalfalfae]RNJ55721.1 cat eye syndrome chromosome region, candidate 1 [Verticillium nonalfalfae]